MASPSPVSNSQLSPKMSTSGSPSKTKSHSTSQTPEMMEVDHPVNPLDRLDKQELIPELFSILHDLMTDKVKAKDFDNQLGGIRLKLDNIKQQLKEVPDIFETIDQRQERIDNLKQSNSKKLDFLNKFKERVTFELPEQD